MSATTTDRPDGSAPSAQIIRRVMIVVLLSVREMSEPTTQTSGLPPAPDGPPPIPRMLKIFGTHGITFVAPASD